MSDKRELATQLQETFLSYARATEDEPAAGILPILLDETVLSELAEENWTRDLLDYPIALLIKARKAMELHNDLLHVPTYLPQTRAILWQAMTRGVLHATLRNPRVNYGKRNVAFLNELGPALLTRVSFKQKELDAIENAVRAELRKEMLDKLDRSASSNLLWILRDFRRNNQMSSLDFGVARVVIHALGTNAPADVLWWLIYPSNE